MFFMWDLLFAFIVAFLLTAIFTSGFRRSGPWSAVWILFVIIFLAAWAGGLWITPIGPSIYEVYFIPFLFVGLIFALLLAALSPPKPPETSEEAIKQERTEKYALNIFLWIFLIVLSIAIIIGYL